MQAVARRRPMAALTLACALATSASCDDVEPARPDASYGDAEIRRGCPAWREPLASPGDPIEGDTWESFAGEFFGRFCTRCHTSQLSGSAARQGAPAGLNWDDEAVVRANLHDIRNAVGVLNYMPPNNPRPTCELRRRVVRWIDAGAP